MLYIFMELHVTLIQRLPFADIQIFMFIFDATSDISSISKYSQADHLESHSVIITITELKFVHFHYRPHDRVADVMVMTVQAVHHAVQCSRSPPDTPTTPSSHSLPHAFDNVTIGAIHRKIYEKFGGKEIFTIGTLMKELRMANIILEQHQRHRCGDSSTTWDSNTRPHRVSCM